MGSTTIRNPATLSKVDLNCPFGICKVVHIVFPPFWHFQNFLSKFTGDSSVLVFHRKTEFPKKFTLTITKRTYLTVEQNYCSRSLEIALWVFTEFSINIPRLLFLLKNPAWLESLDRTYKLGMLPSSHQFVCILFSNIGS